jgi:death-on-curing protein
VTSPADSEERIDYLSLDDALEVAAGVLDDVRIRDLGLLASAVARPRTSVFGADAYPSLPEKAASLLHSLARNHSLIDGNKRLGWAATRVFCLLNRRDLDYTVDDAETLVLAVATGHLEVPELAESIRRHLISTG